MPPVLLVCPGGNGQSDSRDMGPGNNPPLRVGNHELVIVPGAVSQVRRFTLREPASNHIEVTIDPNIALLPPCILTLSYARCGSLPKGVNPQSLTIVEIDPGTTKILRVLPSSVQPGPKTIRTVVLDHSSGYAVAQG